MRLPFALAKELREAELDFAGLLVVLRNEALFVNYASDISAWAADGVSLSLFDYHLLKLWWALDNIVVLVTKVGAVAIRGIVLPGSREMAHAGLASSCKGIRHLSGRVNNYNKLKYYSC